jgi:hypothetical protein
MFRYFVSYLPGLLFIDAIMHAAAGNEMMVFEIEPVWCHSVTQNGADRCWFPTDCAGSPRITGCIVQSPDGWIRILGGPCGRVRNVDATARLLAQGNFGYSNREKGSRLVT